MAGESETERGATSRPERVLGWLDSSLLTLCLGSLVADVGARLALSPIQIPVGVVTGIIGGPYFLYLMRKQDKIGEI